MTTEEKAVLEAALALEEMQTNIDTAETASAVVRYVEEKERMLRNLWPAVAAGVRDAQGFTPRERQKQARKAIRP